MFQQVISQIGRWWLWNKKVNPMMMTMISTRNDYPSSSIHHGSILFRFHKSTGLHSKLKQWVDTYKLQHRIDENTTIPNNNNKGGALKIEIHPHELIEKFIKGSGPGGQKINKTNSCVFLEHIPTGIQIKCQKTRSLAQNRKEAQRELMLRLDEHINGPLSKRALRKQREDRRERKHYQRVKLKYGNTIKTSSPDRLSPPSSSNSTSSPVSENTLYPDPILLKEIPLNDLDKNNNQYTFDHL